MTTKTTTKGKGNVRSMTVSRVFKAPRERVYKALLDIRSPEAARFAPNQEPGRPMDTKVHLLEPKVGGRIRMSMVADAGDHKGTFTNHGTFMELVPNERIVRSWIWEAEGRDPEGVDPSEMKVTFTLRDVPGGTEVTILHEGFGDEESQKGHTEGWTEALENFAAAYETGPKTKAPAAQTGTVRIKRLIKAPQELVYKAFLDPDMLAKWLPPGGFTAKVHSLDARVGGSFRMSFIAVDTKGTHSFGGRYLELTPHSRIRHTDAFETDEPSMKGEMTVTITFTKVAGGTEVDVVQERVPAAIPVEDATTGWGQSMENLARLLEK